VPLIVTVRLSWAKYSGRSCNAVRSGARGITANSGDLGASSHANACRLAHRHDASVPVGAMLLAPCYLRETSVKTLMGRAASGEQCACASQNNPFPTCLIGSDGHYE